MQGGNRRLRYATALGSARETMACFDVAVAMDYLAPLAFAVSYTHLTLPTSDLV